MSMKKNNTRRLDAYKYEQAHQLAGLLCDPDTDENVRAALMLGLSELSITTNVPMPEPAETSASYESVRRSYIQMQWAYIDECRGAVGIEWPFDYFEQQNVHKAPPDNHIHETHDAQEGLRYFLQLHGNAVRDNETITPRTVANWRVWIDRARKERLLRQRIGPVVLAEAKQRRSDAATQAHFAILEQPIEEFIRQEQIRAHVRSMTQ